MMPIFREKCAKFETRWKQQREEAEADAASTAFEGYKNVCMVGTNKEVMDHYPPQYLVGSCIEDMTREIFVEETDMCTVRMFALVNEYMYSNPTGQFNLSLPQRKIRSHLLPGGGLSYIDLKKSQKTGETSEFQQKAADEALEGDEYAEDDEEKQFEGLDVRLWNNHSLVGEVLLKVEVTNNLRDQIKVEIGLEQAEGDDTPLNCNLPLTSFYTQMFSNGIAARPISALIHKIDPTKPFG